MMKSRKSRLAIISDILQQHSIGSQQELAQELSARGYSVTQATLSRDLKKLPTTKVASRFGGYRYVVIDPETSINQIPSAGTLQSSIRTAVISMTLADNILILRTRNGYAAGVANDLDMLQSPMILGVIAGTNTVVAITSKEASTDAIYKLLAKLLPQPIIDQARKSRP
jgi:transcriptional regulator of arginine metabolism